VNFSKAQERSSVCSRTETRTKSAFFYFLLAEEETETEDQNGSFHEAKNQFIAQYTRDHSAIE